MIPVWKNREDWVTKQEIELFNAHVHVCSACAKEFNETTRLFDFLQENWTAIKEDSQDPSVSTAAGTPEKQDTQQASSGFANMQEAWADFQRRCPEFVGIELPSSKRAKVLEESELSVHKDTPRIAPEHNLKNHWGWLTGIAACFIIGGLMWMRFYTTDSHLRQVPSTQSTISDGGATIRIEQIMPDGTSMALPTSGPITSSGNGLKRLRINGNRHIVLDSHTQFSIEPFENSSLPGCLVNLNAGRIHAQVEPDGKPFEVRFAHGKVVITGTTFDINVQDQSTTLIVSEGSVHFESDMGTAIQVTAGKQSVIGNNGIPSPPAQCQADQLMAWATGEKQSAIADPSSGEEFNKLVEELPLPVSYPGRPIDLQSLDYDQWIEEKREWFMGQFPWIFEVQNALAKKEIDVNYPDLLIRSGDVWQIVYPHHFYRQIAVVQKDGLSKVANTYQLDSTWVDQIISQAAKNADLPSLQIFFDEEALNQWLALARQVERSCDDTVRLNVLCEYSMIKSQYLENTRTLAWLCVQNGTFPAASGQKEALLDLLDQQTTSAYQAGQAAWHLSQTEDPSTEEQLQGLITLVQAIIDNEQPITDYRLLLARHSLGDDGTTNY